MTLLFTPDAQLIELWQTYRSNLQAEAQRFGFEPAGPDGLLDPTATAEWRRAFMADYGRAARGD